MPDNLRSWVTVINEMPPEYAGFLMAAIIAVLRVIYDHQETKPSRVFLEALICGGLSLTASSGILALHLDTHWAVFVGGTIGYLGSATIRAIALKIIKKKVK